MGYSHQNRYDGAPDPAALWNLLENVRGYLPLPSQATPQEQTRPRRSVHATVLEVLSDGPRHGGQVVREIADRHDAQDGHEPPGAADVYPELQLLVDEGLATVEESDGRRTYTLTEAGRAEATEVSEDETAPAPWDAFTRLFDGRGELPKSGVKLGQAVHQIALSGNEDQRRRATALLDETRRKIYAILAEDTRGDGADGVPED
ncbi:PadR family transcriptional regulator [Corynebacterium glyciniphilum]|uniref:Putative transcriptional regulator, PadR-family n=1 Tax=Corynebacterium glyciniphilum AJ 3170 TaxID=1404245 RepID=X5E642_9CORY|nr:PadR family transcriptional regulator [Corynebacterium glyciniphilum]AHW62920.1 Putative transcriptional regulator, PadR-family [Corynebacterium glyciniphilum AJ 3170]